MNAKENKSENQSILIVCVIVMALAYMSFPCHVRFLVSVHVDYSFALHCLACGRDELDERRCSTRLVTLRHGIVFHRPQFSPAQVLAESRRFCVGACKTAERRTADEAADLYGQGVVAQRRHQRRWDGESGDL